MLNTLPFLRKNKLIGFLKMGKNRLVIGISGTPGTGKTFITSILKEKLSAFSINLTEIALKNDFITKADNERHTKVANFEKLIPFIEKSIKSHSGNLIIEGHYADIIPDPLLSFLIILRTKPQILEQRLIEKGFPPQKVLENVQSEILGSCTSSALERHDKEKIYEIDTSLNPPKTIIKKIQSLVETQPPSNVGQINWMQELDERTLLKYFV